MCGWRTLRAVAPSGSTRLSPSRSRADNAAMSKLLESFSWRRFSAVWLVWLVFSTEVLFQPAILENWSLEQVARGWFDFFIEVALAGILMWIAVGFAALARPKGAAVHAILASAGLFTGALLGAS